MQRKLNLSERSLLFLLALGLITTTASCEDASDSQFATSVSIFAVLANPERYNGKLIILEGIVDIGESEHFALAPTRDTVKMKDSYSMIWLAPDYQAWKNGEYEYLNGQSFSITGRFDSQNLGHIGAYAGTLLEWKVIH